MDPLAPLRLLHAVRLQLVYVVKEPWAPPPWRGYLLRGALGWALAREACNCGLGDQSDEPEDHRLDCDFRTLFRTTVPDALGRALQTGPDAPRPFVLRPPLDGRPVYAPGDTLTAELILFGRVAAHWRSFLAAAADFVNNDPVLQPPPLELVAVLDGLGRQLNAGQHITPPLFQVLPEAAEPVHALHLLTPLVLRPKRLVKTGPRPAPLSAARLPSSLGLDTLTAAILRRLSLLTALYADGAEGLRPFDTLDRPVRIRAARSAELTDVQTRTGSGGVSGTLRLDGRSAIGARLLRAGALTHVGSQTALDASGWLAVEPAEAPTVTL